MFIKILHIHFFTNMIKMGITPIFIYHYVDYIFLAQRNEKK
ncbi:hypothetical protein XBKB1_1770003 [Xenorhabdus bovienii str. kraussei Becker Underwood]|uniref:Uncharacterized protein n=1 Tax=Xenorhabdus bovienii str. kraussei Becker Underwood TaxID=1398204 RepID=A0A077PRJ9_XENBV|nr:hypothetical protein XBKB1_1770003 [Xenorhabdus bovienii str. kraussei Becker Underwood]